MNKLIGYIAVVLDEKSVKYLKEVIPPIHKKIFYHHMTIAYMPSDDIYEKFKEREGEQVELNIIGFCFDEKGQATLVKTDIYTEGIPRITLSCEENTKPVYSGVLIKSRTNYKDINIKVSGEIQIIRY